MIGLPQWIRLFGIKQLFTHVFHRRSYTNVPKQSHIVFRHRYMHDYHKDKTAVIDLLQRCETTDDVHMTTIVGDKASSAFRLEFTDSLCYMDQYPESYCLQLLDSAHGAVVAVQVINLKRVYFGSYLMTIAFERLFRVDMNRRRQGLATSLYKHSAQWFQYVAPDYVQNYTLLDNNASLNLQQSWSDERKTMCHLDLYIIPVILDTLTTELHTLTREETERLCMEDMVDWINRPVLSDLRRIMKMKEYRGTFSVGNSGSDRYAVASLWQPSTGVICDGQTDMQNGYRGPFYYVFNLFQARHASVDSNNVMQTLLSAISSMTASDGLPFILCPVEQSSPFNSVCRQRALAMTTLVMSQRMISSRGKIFNGQFHQSPIWHDPRDLS